MQHMHKAFKFIYTTVWASDIPSVYCIILHYRNNVSCDEMLEDSSSDTAIPAVGKIVPDLLQVLHFVQTNQPHSQALAQPASLAGWEAW